jgi:hypothetical protein
VKALPPSRKSNRLHSLVRQLIVVLSIAACLAAHSASAQPSPNPTPKPNASVDIGPMATIGFSNAASVRNHCVNGHFRPAAVYANESVTVRLEYLPAFAGISIIATALDGGEVVTPKSQTAIDQNGVAWFRFRAGDKPGLYRVMILADSKRSILKFWVDDPKNPSASPPAIRRGIQG